jgi:hypothetical protein
MAGTSGPGEPVRTGRVQQSELEKSGKKSHQQAGIPEGGNEL